MMRHAGRMAAQHRRAVELPNGKIVEFMPAVGENDHDAAAAYLMRQALPAMDPTDPRETGR